jgi:hypothetical protein
MNSIVVLLCRKWRYKKTHGVIRGLETVVGIPFISILHDNGAVDKTAPGRAVLYRAKFKYCS